MRIELTEVLACPACRPDQGLVAVVERMEGPDLLEGYLGCPFCEARHPVREGHVHFLAAGADGGERAPALRSGKEGRPGGEGRAAAPAEEEPPNDAGAAEERRAVAIAALLGLHERPGGRVLVAPGLAAAADRVAELAEGVEVLAMAPGRPPAAAEEAGRPDRARGGGGGPDAPEAPPAGAVACATRLHGTSPERLPLLRGRLRGIALLGGSAGEAREAARALEEGGRLAVIEPRDGLAGALEELPLERLAAEAAALVAVRRPGP